MRSNEQLSIKTIESLHECIKLAEPNVQQIDDLLLEIGKAIDEAKVNDQSTLLLQRLYEECMWLKTEVAQ